jgi:holo-[acyl-carrier protein] synthase
VLRDELGKPYVNLYNEAVKIASDNNIEMMHVSISNTKDYAVAYAVGESE